MNKNLLKIKDWILFWIWFLLILWIANAAVSLTATSWEWLTAAKWNDLVSKISSISTDGSGNVGIWTDTPNAKLEVTDNLWTTLVWWNSWNNWPWIKITDWSNVYWEIKMHMYNWVDTEPVSIIWSWYGFELQRFTSPIWSTLNNTANSIWLNIWFPSQNLKWNKSLIANWDISWNRYYFNYQLWWAHLYVNDNWCSAWWVQIATHNWNELCFVWG